MRSNGALLNCERAFYVVTCRADLLGQPSLQALRAETMVERSTARMRVAFQNSRYHLALTFSNLIFGGRGRARQPTLNQRTRENPRFNAM